MMRARRHSPLPSDLAKALDNEGEVCVGKSCEKKVAPGAPKNQGLEHIDKIFEP